MYYKENKKLLKTPLPEQPTKKEIKPILFFSMKEKIKWENEHK